MVRLQPANGVMRDEEPPSWRQRREARRLRRPVALVDWLLPDLEGLKLRGRMQVPSSFEPSLRELLDLVKMIPGVLDYRESLQAPGSVPELMAALTGIQEALSAAIKAPSPGGRLAPQPLPAIHGQPPARLPQ